VKSAGPAFVYCRPGAALPGFLPLSFAGAGQGLYWSLPLILLVVENAYKHIRGDSAAGAWGGVLCFAARAVPVFCGRHSVVIVLKP